MADDGSTLVKPTTAGDIKKGSHAILKDYPCKIMDISKSKTGKHGHAKCNITGVCVLTSKKIIDVQPAHAQMFACEVTKTEYQLIGITDNTANCLDDSHNPYDIPLEGEVAEEIKENYDDNDSDTEFRVTVLTAPKQEGDKFIKHEIICAWKKENVKA